MTRTTKLNRACKAHAAALNDIVARRNLYMATPAGNRRVFNAHVRALSSGTPQVFLTDLYSDEPIYVSSNLKLADGYGHSVDPLNPLSA